MYLIAHVNLQGFYVTAEKKMVPGDRPLVITKDRRVLDFELAASGAGLRPGLKEIEAKRRLPDGSFRLYIPDHFREARERFLKQLSQVGPDIEPDADHRAWLGFLTRGLEGAADKGQGGLRNVLGNELREMASRLVPGVAERVALGVGGSKLIARAAAMMIQGGRRLLERLDPGTFELVSLGEPGVLFRVITGKEGEFLAPLSVQFLWPLDRETRSQLLTLGLTTIGEVAAVPGDLLIRKFGPVGKLIHDYTRGLDREPVRRLYPPREREMSVGFAGEIRDRAVLEAALKKMAGQLVRILNRHGEACTLVKLVVSTTAGEDREITRLLARGCSSAMPLQEVLLGLFRQWHADQPVVGLKAVAGGLAGAQVLQMELFEFYGSGCGSRCDPGMLGGSLSAGGRDRGRPVLAGPRATGPVPANPRAGAVLADPRVESVLTNLRRKLPDRAIRLGKDLPVNRMEQLRLFWEDGVKVD